MIEVNVKDKPVILDVRSPVLGLIDDAFFKFVGDVGLGNPKDGGKGAKYFVAYDSYKGKIPKGHIVLRTPTL